MPTCTHAECLCRTLKITAMIYGLIQWFSNLASQQKKLGNIFLQKEKKSTASRALSGLQSQNLRAWASGICMKTKDKTKLPDSYDWCSTKVWELLMYFSNSKVLCFNALWTFFMSCGYTLSFVNNSGFWSLMHLLSYKQCRDSGTQIILHVVMLFLLCFHHKHEFPAYVVWRHFN